uniref:Uncharacterized protein n=1 Tax=Timema tahoe TaxID=61484 RepID=A0A7R9IJ35_9NEOP|nr:unnamed protein product [Timema tahoe]
MSATVCYVANSFKATVTGDRSAHPAFLHCFCVHTALKAALRAMLRRKKTTVRKYGILASREDMEMTPLGAEEDDDDTTLFDVNNHSRQ